jgi:DNA-binding CsgD family transcriptional regulator
MSTEGFNSRKMEGNQKRVITEERSFPPSSAVDKFPGLTPRQSEVLTWVARGKTNADVARILGISPRTVDTLLSRIYQKLGVENRMAAVMRMINFIKLMAAYIVEDFSLDLSFFSAYF